MSYSFALCITILVAEHCVAPPTSGQPYIGDQEMPAVVMSVAAALIYLADRTDFWLKEQKQFSPWVFTFLSLLSLAAGLSTMRQADKDLGFLNREQTDEWKGWMQSLSTLFRSTAAC